MGHLRDKVVVVTGAGRGIGRAVALACAREGARVVVGDNGAEVDGTGADSTVACAVADEIGGMGGEAVASAVDVAADGAAEELISLALGRFGDLSAVVSCAGLSRDRGILHMEDEDVDAFLSTHVRAAFRFTRAAARTFVDRGTGGAILHTTSPSAYFGSARQSGLAAASAAVVGLTRSVAAELRKHKVRVNAIAPTARTRATEHLPMFQGVREGSMSPEHVAEVAAFLVSDLAEDVFGEVIGVAGSRVYAIRARETTGAFAEGGPFTLDALRAVWAEITRS
jgi:NAD(P)-dependent dehydrogenase (short-subunit alcohol dehydrogenase family)